MIDFALTDARRFAISSIGAVLLSATCIAGAVAPARAAEAMTPNAPLTVADWQQDVGRQLDAKLELPAHLLANRGDLTAAIDVSFDRDGNFSGATVAQSSGVGAVDRRVMKIAQEIAYPPLPLGYRGRPQIVSMQAFFAQGSTADAAARQDAFRALANGSRAKHDAVRTAALPSG